MPETDTIKYTLGLLAAWSLGLWCGIRWLGQSIPLTYDPRVEAPPAWVAEAEQMLTFAIAGFALCVIGWLYLDIKHSDLTKEDLRDAFEYND